MGKSKPSLFCNLLITYESFMIHVCFWILVCFKNHSGLKHPSNESVTLYHFGLQVVMFMREIGAALPNFWMVCRFLMCVQLGAAWHMQIIQVTESIVCVCVCLQNAELWGVFLIFDSFSRLEGDSSLSFRSLSIQRCFVEARLRWPWNFGRCSGRLGSLSGWCVGFCLATKTMGFVRVVWRLLRSEDGVFYGFVSEDMTQTCKGYCRGCHSWKMWTLPISQSFRFAFFSFFFLGRKVKWEAKTACQKMGKSSLDCSERPFFGSGIKHLNPVNQDIPNKTLISLIQMISKVGKRVIS